MKNIVSDEIRSLTPYPPGKPIEEVEREYGIKGSIKLASNENPLGPSPKAVEAILKNINILHRYPDGSCFYLKRKLAEYLKVESEMLIIGNGSNEIIEFVVKTFLRPGEEAVMGNPSFAVYPTIVRASRGKPIQVPLKGFVHDLDAMSEAITSKTRLMFIANPNNPTGTIVTGDDLDRFLGKLPDRVIVVIDEAYREYVTDKEFPNSLEYIKKERYTIILRTFSKIYGLAGMRIGYGIACQEMVSYMEKVRQPFNVNALAQIAADAALEDEEHLKRSIDNNTNEMNRLFREMKILGFECVPSQANFFLIKVGQGKKVYEELLRNGIIVRPMDSYGLFEYIRVTVGLPEENERFIETFRTVTETL